MYIPSNKCRNCEHYHEYLSNDDYLSMLNHNGPYSIGRCFYLVSNGGSCLCKEFIPHDNLEFIEWKYSQCMANADTDE